MRCSARGRAGSPRGGNHVHGGHCSGGATSWDAAGAADAARQERSRAHRGGAQPETRQARAHPTQRVGLELQLERDPSNHPTYLATDDGSDLIDKRQASKIERAEEKARQQEQLFADEELGDDDLDNLY